MGVKSKQLVEIINAAMPGGCNVVEKRLYYAMGCSRCHTAVKWHPQVIGGVMLEQRHQCVICCDILEQVAYDIEERRDEFIREMRDGKTRIPEEGDMDTPSGYIPKKKTVAHDDQVLVEQMRRAMKDTKFGPVTEKNFPYGISREIEVLFQRRPEAWWRRLIKRLRWWR